MAKHSVFKITFLLVLFFFVYLLFPPFQFYLYNDKLPISPIGTLSIPKNKPVHQDLLNESYQTAGDKALALITKHIETINAPGITAAVAIDGTLVWAGAAGWADIETRKAMTTNTQFRIGSTSKALTATALARLVQSGKIDLDRHIAHYVKDLPNAQWRNITPRQLASHMAGLPDYKEVRDWWGLYHIMALRKHFNSSREALDIFDGMPLMYEPGSRFSYSSLNTVLLSAVMAEALSEKYLGIMDKEVFQALKLEHTQAEPQNGNTKMATFYWNQKGKSARVKEWRKTNLSHRLAGGGFISTSKDLVTLGSAWLDDEYISPQVRSMFWTPQTLSNGKVNQQAYALGWRYRPAQNALGAHANHGGVSLGAQSWLMVMPESKMVVAVNINAKTKKFWDFAQVSMMIAELFAFP